MTTCKQLKHLARLFIQTRTSARRCANASSSVFLRAEAFCAAAFDQFCAALAANSQSWHFPAKFSGTCLFPFPRVTELASLCAPPIPIGEATGSLDRGETSLTQIVSLPISHPTRALP